MRVEYRIPTWLDDQGAWCEGTRLLETLETTSPADEALEAEFAALEAEVYARECLHGRWHMVDAASVPLEERPEPREAPYSLTVVCWRCGFCGYLEPG